MLTDHEIKLGSRRTPFSIFSLFFIIAVIFSVLLFTVFFRSDAITNNAPPSTMLFSNTGSKLDLLFTELLVRQDNSAPLTVTIARIQDNLQKHITATLELERAVNSKTINIYREQLTSLYLTLAVLDSSLDPGVFLEIVEKNQEARQRVETEVQEIIEQNRPKVWIGNLISPTNALVLLQFIATTFLGVMVWRHTWRVNKLDRLTNANQQYQALNLTMIDNPDLAKKVLRLKYGVDVPDNNTALRCFEFLYVTNIMEDIFVATRDRLFETSQASAAFKAYFQRPYFNDNPLIGSLVAGNAGYDPDFVKYLAKELKKQDLI